jgi:hypothetical protein
VREAVALLESAPDPVACFARIAEAQRRLGSRRWPAGAPGRLGAIPAVARLALEMAAHEEAERRALEGELAELEQAWRQAEELAAIADDLLVPWGVQRALARLKGRKEHDDAS